jgi:hypothetical protein
MGLHAESKGPREKPTPPIGACAGNPISPLFRSPAGGGRRVDRPRWGLRLEPPSVGFNVARVDQLQVLIFNDMDLLRPSSPAGQMN